MNVPHQTSQPAVAIIDDEEDALRSASLTLRRAGCSVYCSSQPRKALDRIAGECFDAVILDILMPGFDGRELLTQIGGVRPETPVIMVTALNDAQSAVTCLKNGAFDYLVKPFDKERLVSTVLRAVDHAALCRENQLLKERLLDDRLHSPGAFEDIVTRNRRMLSIFKYLEAIAPSPMPVLVTGETGTGKELIARAVHATSNRFGAFIAVNVSGLDDQLFSDTLFGHGKGAFTGAETSRPGLVAAADKGTLFLDEIGELSSEAQVKLLRLVEGGSYYRVGMDTPLHADVRIVVATNADLERKMQDRFFRADLLYRLRSHRVELPPLRERPEDIPLLTAHFVETAAAETGRPAIDVSPECFVLLRGHSWPGNVRELKGLLYDAVSRCGGSELRPGDLAGLVSNGKLGAPVCAGDSASFTAEHLTRFGTLPSLKELERMLIEEALRRAGDNQTIAAQLLGMTRSALNKRLVRARDSQD